VLVTRAVAVWYLVVFFRACYYNSDCVVLNGVSCVVLDPWLYSCGIWSVSGTRAVAVW
jgi:hypothetical protein